MGDHQIQDRRSGQIPDRRPDQIPDPRPDQIRNRQAHNHLHGHPCFLAELHHHYRAEDSARRNCQAAVLV